MNYHVLMFLYVFEALWSHVMYWFRYLCNWVKLELEVGHFWAHMAWDTGCHTTVWCTRACAQSVFKDSIGVVFIQADTRPMTRSCVPNQRVTRSMHTGLWGRTRACKIVTQSCLEPHGLGSATQLCDPWLENF